MPAERAQTGQNAANRAVSRDAFRRQGSHRQGHGHGLCAWHLDSRRGRGAERLGPARSGLFAARRESAPQARHRRRSRHPHRRGRTDRRRGGARDGAAQGRRHGPGRNLSPARGGDEHAGVRHRNRAGRGVRAAAVRPRRSVRRRSRQGHAGTRAPGIGQRFPAARAAAHRGDLLRVPLARWLPGLEPG